MTRSFNIPATVSLATVFDDADAASGTPETATRPPRGRTKASIGSESIDLDAHDVDFDVARAKARDFDDEMKKPKKPPSPRNRPAAGRRAEDAGTHTSPTPLARLLRHQVRRRPDLRGDGRASSTFSARIPSRSGRTRTPPASSRASPATSARCSPRGALLDVKGIGKSHLLAHRGAPRHGKARGLRRAQGEDPRGASRHPPHPRDGSQEGQGGVREARRHVDRRARAGGERQQGRRARRFRDDDADQDPLRDPVRQESSAKDTSSTTRWTKPAGSSTRSSSTPMSDAPSSRGSLRRRRETIKDIDILVSASEPGGDHGSIHHAPPRGHHRRPKGTPNRAWSSSRGSTRTSAS